MRDALHIGGLFLVFAFLATRFPSVAPLPQGDDARPAFASFVTLSSEAHAARLESARTSWQVRSQARGRPSIGRLDSGIPLLSDALPAPAQAEFPRLDPDASSLPPPDAETYALLPGTEGAAMPEFAPRARKAESGDAPARPPAFGREEMLSTDNSTTLKEIMR